jgi:xylan 1,4-beta-xylosidase
VDFARTIGRIRSFQAVNAGPLPSRGSGPALLEQYRLIGIDYVRTHDDWQAYDIDVIFPSMQADPSSESSYSFASTDYRIKAIESIGAKVFYRLGYSWGNSVTPTPDGFTRFAEVCKHIVMHYNYGWANGFHLGIRYWEIWNEPDIEEFWKGTPEQYYELYETVARTIKTLDPNLMVGGPALAWDRSFLKGFLEFCKLNDAPIDFVSWHIYPRSPPYSVAEAAREVQEMLSKYGFENTESIISEWNYSAASPRPPELSNARGVPLC